MTKPVTDKAEIAARISRQALYRHIRTLIAIRGASRSDRYRVDSGTAGGGDVRKSIHMHINFGLFADILRRTRCNGPPHSQR